MFTAHLDHLGIGKPINGDSIYNGAMDNASGIAAMLDVAAMLKESGTKLRRIGAVRRRDRRGEGAARARSSSPAPRPSTPGRSWPTSIPTCSCRSSRSRS